MQDVVGKEIYSAWVEMLHMLVPDGRTHRLSVVIAGMLNYALDVAVLNDKGNYTEDKDLVAMSLIDSTETADPEDVKRLLHIMVTQLFNDAKVTYERTSKSGEHYSIADEAYNEFINWFDYPWD